MKYVHQKKWLIMKTKIKKDFDAVKFMRQARDKISMEISDMDYKQIKEYFVKRLKKGRIIPGHWHSKHLNSWELKNLIIPAFLYSRVSLI